VVRSWPLLHLRLSLIVLVVATVASWMTAVTIIGLRTPITSHDVLLYSFLLCCDVGTVELTRRTGELSTHSRDANGVWELPAALVLPPVYGMLIPVLPIIFMQLRVRKTLHHRRVFSMAALGISGGIASVVFHALSPLSADVPGIGHPLTWGAIAVLCGVLRLATNKIMVLAAIKSSDPLASVRGMALTKELIFGDIAEISIGVLVAASPVLTLLALPSVILLQRSQRHTQLLTDARTDGKTGLLNAITWQREASIQIARAIRSKIATHVAVMLIDIDHFKIINDTLGHQAGDVLLKSVSQLFSELLRSYDLCGRFGGDEFAVLLPDTDRDEAEGVADRLSIAVSNLTVPYEREPSSHLPAVSPRITISVGVAVSGRPDSPDYCLDELVMAADTALYSSKSAGRNAVSIVSMS